MVGRGIIIVTKESGDMTGKRPLIDNGNGTHTVPTANSDVSAVIDSDLAEIVSKHNWYGFRSRNQVYLCTRMAGLPSAIMLHHVVVGCPIKPMVTDHVNRNGLDNRRANLRTVTVRENGINRVDRSRTGFTGVYATRFGTFQSFIRINGKRVSLGNRSTAEEAYQLYVEAQKAL